MFNQPDSSARKSDKAALSCHGFTAIAAKIDFMKSRSHAAIVITIYSTRMFVLHRLSIWFKLPQEQFS